MFSTWNIAALAAAVLYTLAAHDLSQAQIAYLSDLDVGRQATYWKARQGYQFDGLLWAAAEAAGCQAAALFFGTRTYWILSMPGLLVVGTGTSSSFDHWAFGHTQPGRCAD